ncbi:PQQ-binding-like beta-propeller repeat protein [Sphingomonas sp. LY29]|uniref:outer membrane protein assembly factor BamB family protein n=1 Tax=unclassified Sphingomonas TaxID=196159 RepID=UPI002ADEB5DF|nr:MULTISPECIES: PQQ-binding-like beta-propeller repeat protein [unclassified Sphingomonas]MEA1071937.1 PQQ-binding-like beta-propeller repeat protein [Sphingomonas sp. LY160]WRP25376.1 PQQ-binding-like beta-propeller repeat protein [Sphingomonas sp. LY29]
MRSSNRLTILLITTALMAGCSGGLFKKKPPPKVAGDRIAVLVNEVDIAVDPATAALPMALPAATELASWPQSGGNARKSVGHAALGQALSSAWTASIGAGSSRTARLGGGPVVDGGRVFTIDTRGVVRAFDAATGASVWQASFGDAGKNAASLFGGGVAAEGGRVYATNGLGYVAALDAATGAAAWTVRPGGPLRGEPSVDGGNVYVMSQDNQLYSLKASDGSTNWSSAAALEIAGVSGAAAPSIGQGTVIAGFSSGELNAYRYENGRQVWQDALSRTSITTSVSSLSDIDADAVIDNGVVYAIGQGGRMVALDLLSGQRIWELNFAGIATPWVAGDWLFAVNDRAQLLAIARANGKIRWITQLPRFENEKKRSGPISYVGPVLAGDRLVIAGNNGALINVAPIDGAIQSQTSVGDGVSFQPVVANNTLFLLTDSGRLIAYR